MTAQIQKPGQGIATVDMGGNVMTVKADATTSDDAFVVIESTFLPGGLGGFVMPLHLHREIAECMYVLEGSLDVRVGDEHKIAIPGTFIAIPPGTPHTMAPVGEASVRALMIMSNPTRAMQMGEIMAQIFASGAPDPETAGPLLAQIDMEILEPVSL